MQFNNDTLTLLTNLYAVAAKLNRKNMSLKRHYLGVSLRNLSTNQAFINELLNNFDVEVNSSFIQDDFIGNGLEIPVSESVRLLGFTHKLKKTTNYIQKLAIIQLILEQYRIGDIQSQIKNDVLDVVCVLFKVRLADYQLIKFFTYIDLSETDFDENTIIISSNPLSKQEALQDKKHILMNGLKGYLVFKNVSGLLLFKYQGIQTNYFFNSSLLESSRTHTFIGSSQLMLENVTLNYETVSELLYKTYKFNDLKIEATTKTPEVSLDKELGELKLVGRLYPENPFAFFDTINVWLDYYFSINPSKLNIFLNISYYNTTSSKLLLNLLKKISSFRSQSFELSITWQYEKEDEEMQKTIANFSNLLECPIIAVEETD
jgi:hypothetical protein